MTLIIKCGACGGACSKNKISVHSSIDDSHGTFGECENCATLRVLDKIDYDKLYSTRESSNYPDKVGILVLLKQLILQNEAKGISLLSNSASSKILDYGCGGGEFSNAIFKATSLFVSACDMQNERPGTLLKDIQYICVSDIAEAGLFDIIVLRHVLEHIEDPRAALENIAKQLAPNGQIFIEVPWNKSLFRELMGSRWPGYFFPFHVHVFSEQGLRDLATRCGLTVKSFKQCNIPIFGVFFMKLGIGRTLSRILSALLYPIQCFLNWITKKHEAVQIILTK